jgi:rubrerythrin
MGIYCGAEIFQIAMEMEEAGRAFYETLAEVSGDQDVAELCRILAAQETSHYRMFKKMGEEVVQRPPSRPLTWDELHFAQMLIEERVLSEPDSARDIALKGDVAGILETAIRIEKDSVLFYNELLDQVDEEDAAAVQEIIDEEKQHVRILIEARRRLRSQPRDVMPLQVGQAADEGFPRRELGVDP